MRLDGPMRFMVLLSLLLSAGVRFMPHVKAQPGVDEANNAAVATVLLTAQIWLDENGQSSLYRECAMGSGSIISGTGDILTNSHVVDVWASLENVAHAAEVELKARDPGRVITLTRRPEVNIWMVDGQDRNASKRYTATVMENDPLRTRLRTLDLALLAITGDPFGERYDRPVSGLPHVELGDSDALSSRTVTIFGYPSLDGARAASEDTTGEAAEVSCIPPPSETIQRFEGRWTGYDQSVSPTKLYVAGDATFGNSGGSAVDDQGKLIGVPTRVEAFAGGSRVVLVPINRATAVLRELSPELLPTSTPSIPPPTQSSTSPPSVTFEPKPAGEPTSTATAAPAGTLVPPPGYGVVEVHAFACPADEAGERTEFLTDAQVTIAFSPQASCRPADAEFTLTGLDSVGGPDQFHTGEDGQYQVAVPPKAYLLTQTNPDLPGTSSQGFWVREVPGPTRVIVINYLSSLTSASTESTATSTLYPSVAEDNGLGNVLMSGVLENPPDAPVTVRMLRLTLAPGASVPMHAHPGVELDYVESGVLTVSSTGTMMVSEGYNRFATGEPQELTEGSSVRFDTGTTMSLANTGTEDAIVLSAVMLSVADGGETITYTGGTPTDADFDGVSFDVLGDGLIQEIPEGSAIVTVDRIGAGPGEPVPGFDGVAMLSKVSGPLAFTVSEGTVQVSRTANPALQPNALPGDEFELNDNDAAFFPSGYEPIQREGSDDQLELLRLLIQPDEEIVGEPAVVLMSSP